MSEQPAGWYDNPEGDGERWWTGQEWTSRTRTSPDSRSIQPSQIVGWIAVALFAAGGLFGPQLLAWQSFGFAAAVATWLLQ